MGELVQFEDYVTEVSVTKQIRGGKLPARVYTIVIMEPDAVNLKELAQMKQQQNAPQKTPEQKKVEQIREEHAPNMNKFKEAADGEVGTPKK